MNYRNIIRFLQRIQKLNLQHNKGTPCPCVSLQKRVYKYADKTGNLVVNDLANQLRHSDNINGVCFTGHYLQESWIPRRIDDLNVLASGYLSYSFDYTGPICNIPHENDDGSSKALSDAIESIHATLKKNEIKFKHQYAWPDGSLYLWVKCDDKEKLRSIMPEGISVMV